MNAKIIDGNLCIERSDGKFYPAWCKYDQHRRCSNYCVAFQETYDGNVLLHCINSEFRFTIIDEEQEGKKKNG